VFYLNGLSVLSSLLRAFALLVLFFNFPVTKKVDTVLTKMTFNCLDRMFKESKAKKDSLRAP